MNATISKDPISVIRNICGEGTTQPLAHGGLKAAGAFPLRSFLLSLMGALFCIYWGSAPSVFAATFKVTPVAQITINAEGQPLRFPGFVFYDRNFDETYVVDVAKSIVTVYADDFFPLASFGHGRNVSRPQDGYVDSKGLIYLCQASDRENPARITVYNGAFMPTRVIYLDNIPDAGPDFFPVRIAVNRDGLIYLVGQNSRGVAVLDADGTFLRWLRPMDLTNWTPPEQEEVKKAKSDDAGKNSDLSKSPQEQAKQEATAVDIPEQFRPKTKEEKEAAPGPHLGPVVVRLVTIDREGRIYVVSDETSKTYVYSPEETFLFSFGEKGGGPRMLSTPRGLAIDENRHIIYVVDYMRHEILVYSQKDGKFLFEFGGKGNAPGWFNFPSDIFVNRRGQLVIADLFNHRVQVLDVQYQPDAGLTPESPQAPPEKSMSGDKTGETGPAKGDEANSSIEEKGDEATTAPDAQQPASFADPDVPEDAEKAPIIETRSHTEEESRRSEPAGSSAAENAPQLNGSDEKGPANSGMLKDEGE